MSTPPTSNETDLPTSERKVVLIGQGYVGLPLAMRAVGAGHEVVGYEIDKVRVAQLRNGQSYIDDVSDGQLSEALATGRYLPSDIPADLKEFAFAVITVPTPLQEGVPDLSYIRAATETVAGALTAGATVILESTTYPGTTEEVVQPILERISGLVAGRDFHLGYSPERIDPGNEIWTFRRTPKVVSGIDEASTAAIGGFYGHLVDVVVPVKGTREAELTKLVENTFRHVNIALVNELAIHARELDIDFGAVIEAASTKPFGFMPFYPGPGVGGHCLPVDPSYLSWIFEQRLGSVSRFVKVANEVNGKMPGYVGSRVQAGLNKRKKAMNGSKVLVLGLAYKKNLNDARETPATGLIRHLLALGAEVCAHDPHVGRYELDEAIVRVDSLTPELVEGSDAVVIVTDHDCFDYDMVLDRASYVLDTRRRLPERPAVEYL